MLECRGICYGKMDDEAHAPVPAATTQPRARDATPQIHANVPWFVSLDVSLKSCAETRNSRN
jgi:hypothetical protein